jgi:Zn-finger nucleic acid-binding protein
MELFASRGYFFCRYCGSFHFPETVGDDGVRVLGASKEELSCSGCRKPLLTALLDEAHPIHYCENCRGVLMRRRDFATVVHARRAWASGQPPPPVLLNQAELGRKMTCPSCQKTMATHPYYGPGNVVIDTCEPCEAVWLDFGELSQIVAAPGKDRGSRGHVSRETSTTVARVIGSTDIPDDGHPFDVLDLLRRLF